MEMQDETQNLSIGQLARRSGVSVKTIRFYSDAGLLPPQRSSAGHRRYDSTDLARLTLIRNLRSLDVGLDTIGESSPARPTCSSAFAPRSRSCSFVC